MDAFFFEEVMEAGRKSPSATIINDVLYEFNFRNMKFNFNGAPDNYLLSTVEGSVVFTPKHVLVIDNSGDPLSVTLEYFQNNYQLI